jgi:diguanylate cyclase (GGDEF)-like protein
LAAGFLAVIAGMSAYAVTVAVADYSPGGPADLPFLVGFLLLGTAARRTNRAAPAPAPLVDPAYLRWRGAFTAASTLAVGGLATFAAVAPRTDSWMAGAVIVATVLLAARVGIGAGDHVRLDTRTRERDRLAAVIDLSGAIAGSLDPDRVLAKIAVAAAGAGGRVNGRAVVFDLAEAREVVAPGEGGAGPAPVRLDAAAFVAASVRKGAREIRWTGEHGARSGTASTEMMSAVAALVAGGELLGYVEAWTPGSAERFAPEDLAALTAIGQQGGLAVRNARLYADLEKRANSDGLTGLLNRSAALAALKRELAALSGPAAPLGVLMIDVDGFKACNDTYGHIAGDRLLRELTSALGDCLEPGDFAGRYGGDEFIVALPGAGRSDTELAARRIAGRIDLVALTEGDATLRLRVSIGSAIAPVDGETAEALIAVADRAMYAAKQRARTEPRDAALTR